MALRHEMALSGLLGARPSTLRVLVVEDDPFQQMTLKMMKNLVESKNPNLTVNLTLTSSGTAAVGACSAAGSDIDLVLLDYKLPGGDADTVLPAIRRLVGSVAAIVVLSSSAQEEGMQRCWLDHGADSYRIKPVTVQLLTDVFAYTLHKQRYLQKRSHEDDAPNLGKRSRGLVTSPSRSETPPSVEAESSEQYQEAPGILSLLANGRRGPVRLGFAAGGVPVAIKVSDHKFVRGSPPAGHPYLNRVIKRVLTGGQCVEVRELCEGGEFFDAMLDDLFDGASTEETVFFWFGRWEQESEGWRARGQGRG